MEFTRRRLLAVLLAAPLAVQGQEDGALPPISKEEEERLKKFLPRTFGKLQRREPVYVAVCGDEISSYSAPGLPYTAASHVMAWYGRFLDRLGTSFYYHGGVQDVRPPVPGASAALEQQWAEYRKLRAAWEKTREGDPPPTPGVPPDTVSGPRAEFSVADILRLSQPADGRVPARNAFYAANYTSEGAVAVQVLDPLRSQVYHTEESAMPDLVFIGCGARDALEGASLATLRTVLESAVAECRAKGSDVILAGPPPALDEADERAAIGRARPWAAVMREVAEAAGIFFADLGAAAVHQPSDLLNRTVENAFRSALPPVRAMFDHGPKVQNSFHPNSATHIRMGERTADWLRRAEPARPWEISGWLALSGGENGEDVMVIRVASKSGTPLTVALCPLRFTGWSVQPGWPDKVHTFEPGRGARRFKFPVKRSTDVQPGHEPFIRGSLLLIDDDAQHLVDVKIEVRPLALLWPEERVDSAGAAHLLKCSLVNTDSERELDAALELEWRGARTPLPPVKVAPGKSQPVVIHLPLPATETELRFRQAVTVHVTADGHSWPFTRRIEGVRHLGLNRKTALVQLAGWRAGNTGEASSPSPEVSVRADLNGIYMALQIPAALESDEVPDKPWGRLEVQFDGRGPGENGTLGSVGRVVMEFPRADGRARILQPLRAAVFGVRSNAQCHPDSIVGSSVMQADGSRRIEFNMKRGNLLEHEWSLDGFGQNVLGMNLRLLLGDARTGGWSEARTWVLAGSPFPWADARSLTALELRTDPAPKWSLRIS
jgi:hypothetical protein